MSALNYLNLQEADLDKPIYRIMKQEHVFNLFSERKNVLSRVSNWKDKFENFQMALGGVLDGQSYDFAFKDQIVGQCWTKDSLSEAMWGIYANDPRQRFLRIRSTPRLLLTALAEAHSLMPQDTCFIGGVRYRRESELKASLGSGGTFSISAIELARPLLMKRRAFKHEAEVRLIYLCNADDCDDKGLHRYPVDPHMLITQIMADPNRDRSHWVKDRAQIKKATGFAGPIKRSKIYDPPDWAPPSYRS